MKLPILLSLSLTVNIAFSQQPKLILPVGHTSGITTAIFSPDGKKIVTASYDNSVKIWERATGKLLVNMTEHMKGVEHVTFSVDGEKIVTASEDHTAKVWSSKTGILLTTLKGHTEAVKSARFSPDGKTIITASLDSTAKIWDCQTGNQKANLKLHSGSVLTASFSSAGKKIVTASLDSTAKIWDTETGTLLLTLRGHTDKVNAAVFTSDGNKVITVSDDGRGKIWSAISGKLLNVLEGHYDHILSVAISPDSKKVATGSRDGSAKIWNIETGRLTKSLEGHIRGVNSVAFSPDGNTVVTASTDHTVKIWSTDTGNLLIDFKEHRNSVSYAAYAPDGRSIVTSSFDNTAKAFDVATGYLLFDLKGATSDVTSSAWYPDGTKIVTGSYDNIGRIWDVETGTVLFTLNGHNKGINSIDVSPDNKTIVTTGWDQKVKLWHAFSGKLITELEGRFGLAPSAFFSGDGKKILTFSRDKNYPPQLWDGETGTLLKQLDGHDGQIISAVFSGDSKKIAICAFGRTPKIWNAESGRLMLEIKDRFDVTSLAFSADGKKIFTGSFDGDGSIWNTETGVLLAKLNGHHDDVMSAVFSSDDKKILTTSIDKTIKLWDVEAGKLLADLKSQTGWAHLAIFTPDGNSIVSFNSDTVRVWGTEIGILEKLMPLRGSHSLNSIHFPTMKGIAIHNSEVSLVDLRDPKILRQMIAVDSSDYLTYDIHGRYDGTEAARKLLYFTCDDEIISLDQVKDQLWVPNLAERISKGETISAPKLSDLNICGLTPLVEMKDDGKSYSFMITPRQGGLGETALLVNGIEVKRYRPTELVKKDGTFQLYVSSATLKDFLVDGIENAVTVKAFTANNNIVSRGITSIRQPPSSTDKTPPNLYAVMVGVSDYKGTELDLKYAAKDAADLSNAIGSSARKLLNRDGKEHVFLYQLTTAADRTKFPEKQAIKQVLDEIGKKATSKDILLIFFAGHGVTEGAKKQFYFLTADASKNGDVLATGISTAELNEWIKPQNIKAQKRILIFDACNSGQAINDLVTIGNKDDGYIAARNDDETNRIKAVEKLNERSGMFILSASATNQSAYELGRYSQGLLTYALLKAIKEQPDILEDGRFLNVDKWFSAAEETVSEISKRGDRQQPQKFGTGGFNIGQIDHEVIASIALPQETPLFASSIFINLAAGDDDHELTKEVNTRFNAITSRSIESKISYIPSTNDPEAYSLTGTYEIIGNVVKVKVNIKQKNVMKHRFEVTGDVNNLSLLANNILGKVEAWVDLRK